MKKEDIKLKKGVKTCNHCAAFYQSMGGNQICSLGYRTEKDDKQNKTWKGYNTWEDLAIRIKPAEPCPKPKNIRECVEIRETGLDIHRWSNPESPEYKSMNYQTMSDEESKRQRINYTRDR